MRAAEVGGWTLAAGAVLGIIGFLRHPRSRPRRGLRRRGVRGRAHRAPGPAAAWAATVHAVKGVALSVGVELAAALLATAVWVIGVLL